MNEFVGIVYNRDYHFLIALTKDGKLYKIILEYGGVEIKMIAKLPEE
jgi:hypothetical protein